MNKFEVGNKYMFDDSGIIEINENKNGRYYFKIISGMKNRALLWFENGSDFALHLRLYEAKEKTFTKADLHNGDVVVRRDGSVRIVCLETGTLISKEGFGRLAFIDDDLTYINTLFGNQHDIMKVYRPKNPWQCQFDKSRYTEGDLVFDRERDIKPKFDRQKWIGDMYKRFMYDERVNSTRLMETKSISIIVYNTQNPNKNGIAICKDGDIFNSETGIAVAYAKYLGETVPKEI